METRFIVVLKETHEFLFFSSYDEMLEEIEVKDLAYDDLIVFEQIEFP